MTPTRIRALGAIGGVLLLALVGIDGYTQETAVGSATLVGPYLGQSAPGLKPALFAPGVVSTDTAAERDMTFSRDGQELYFGRNGRMLWSRCVEKAWSVPEPAPFTGDYQALEPFITFDNQRLYFISQRPLSGTGPAEPWQIWFADRAPGGWGQPVRFTETGEYYPTLTRDGVMLVTGPDNDLYFTRVVDDHIGPKEKLGPEINTAAGEYNAYIAPDGSYIIMTSHGWAPHYGQGDLFISFRNSDGGWATPRNMGYGINSGAIDYCPSVSPDGRYFFFASRRGASEDVYWVDAAIIDTLRGREIDPAAELYAAALSDPRALPTVLDWLQCNYAAFCEFSDDLLAVVAWRAFREQHGALATAMYRVSAELFPAAVTDLFRLRSALVAEDQSALAELAEQLQAKAATLTRRDELQINNLAYEFVFAGRPRLGLAAFKLNTALFPQSGNVFDSYGECLLTLGDTAAAVVNYRKSLELTPENDNAVKVLHSLGEQPGQ
jgi:tetratricopeptide (TPR) repeat protein